MASKAHSATNDVEKSVQEKHGGSRIQDEEHVIPKNSLGVVFFGLMCCIFLAALDQVCRDISRLHIHNIICPTDRCGNCSADHCFAPRRRKVL